MIKAKTGRAHASTARGGKSGVKFHITKYGVCVYGWENDDFHAIVSWEMDQCGIVLWCVQCCIVQRYIVNEMLAKGTNSVCVAFNCMNVFVC